MMDEQLSQALLHHIMLTRSNGYPLVTCNVCEGNDLVTLKVERVGQFRPFALAAHRNHVGGL